MQKVGKQKQHQANQSSLLFAELHAIVVKTFGLADILRNALFSLKKDIKLAFIYGSIAKNEDTANSDIDLMLISDTLSYADIFPLLEEPQKQLGRAINPTFYSEKDWISKFKKRSSFINRIIEQPKIFLIGTESELNKLGQSS